MTNKKKILTITTLLVFTVFIFLFTPRLTFAFSLNPFDFMGEWMNEFCQTLANGIYSLGLWVFGLAMFMSDNFLTSSLGTATGPATHTEFIRNLVLSFYGVIILIVAFMNLFRYNLKEWGVTTIIPRMFLSIFLVVFSKPICGVIYDLSSVITNQIRSTYTANAWSDFIANNPFSGTITTTSSNIMVGALMLVMSVLSFVALLVVAIILILRAIVLMVLIALAPLAFACLVLPWTRSIHQKWWKEFTTWIFYLPLSVFLISLGMSFVNTAVSIPSATSYLQSQPGGSSLWASFATAGLNSFITPFLMMLTSLIAIVTGIVLPFSLLRSTKTMSSGMKSLDWYRKPSGVLAPIANTGKDKLYGSLMGLAGKGDTGFHKALRWAAPHVAQYDAKDFNEKREDFGKRFDSLTSEGALLAREAAQRGDVSSVNKILMDYKYDKRFNKIDDASKSPEERDLLRRQWAIEQSRRRDMNWFRGGRRAAMEAAVKYGSDNEDTIMAETLHKRLADGRASATDASTYKPLSGKVSKTSGTNFSEIVSHIESLPAADQDTAYQHLYSAIERNIDTYKKSADVKQVDKAALDAIAQKAQNAASSARARAGGGTTPPPTP